jgi:uncharacterized membrane protein YgcG
MRRFLTPVVLLATLAAAAPAGADPLPPGDYEVRANTISLQVNPLLPPFTAPGGTQGVLHVEGDETGPIPLPIQQPVFAAVALPASAGTAEVLLDEPAVATIDLATGAASIVTAGHAHFFGNTTLGNLGAFDCMVATPAIPAPTNLSTAKPGGAAWNSHTAVIALKGDDLLPPVDCVEDADEAFVDGLLRNGQPQAHLLSTVTGTIWPVGQPLPTPPPPPPAPPSPPGAGGSGGTGGAGGGGTAGGGAGGGAQNGTTGGGTLWIGSRLIRVGRGGVGVLTVRCLFSGARCQGRVLVSSVQVSSHRASAAVRYASVRFDLAPGARKGIKVRFGRRALATLRKRGRLTVRVTVKPDGGSPVTKRLTVRRKR